MTASFTQYPRPQPPQPPKHDHIITNEKMFIKQTICFPLAEFYRLEHNPKAIIVSIINTLHRILILQLKSCWSLWHATINVSIIKNYKLFGDYFDNFLSSSSCKEKGKQIFEKGKFQELHKNINSVKKTFPFSKSQGV